MISKALIEQFEASWATAPTDEKAVPVYTEGELYNLAWLWFSRGVTAERQDALTVIAALKAWPRQP